MPCPRPVEPSFSRANRLSKTSLRPTLLLFSNSRPTCSNTRFLLDTSRSMMTFGSASSFAIKLIEDSGDLKSAACSCAPRGLLRGLILDACAAIPLRQVFLFVLDDIAVKFVDEAVDRCIHVGR